MAAMATGYSSWDLGNHSVKNQCLPPAGLKLFICGCCDLVNAGALQFVCVEISATSAPIDVRFSVPSCPHHSGWSNHNVEHVQGGKGATKGVTLR